MTSLFDWVQRASLISFSELLPFRSSSNTVLFDLLKNRFQLSEQKLLELISDNMRIPFQRLSMLVPDKKLIDSFEKETLQTYRFLPLYENGMTLGLAIDNPFNEYLETLKQTWPNLKPTLISSQELTAFLGDSAHQSNTILARVLHLACEKKASDIHLHSVASGCEIQFRMEGVLYPMLTCGPEETAVLKSLIKLHAHMDISQITQPQDGRLSTQYEGRHFDIRAASLPTVFGEDFVLRLFHMESIGSHFSSLGFRQEAVQLIEGMAEQESGLVLVTGPTGSGKTTTLYTFLSYLLQYKKRTIVTLEDPVEAILPGIRQSQINPSIGYTFSSGLKAILRQDPDCIMIGEIRDQHTAQVALEAAYTGHLVLASLHTSDCRSTLLRLSGFGLDPFLVSYALKGIVSQKLVKKHCACQTGCVTCDFKGHLGRQLISECLKVDHVFHGNPFLDSQAFLEAAQFDSFETDARCKFV